MRLAPALGGLDGARRRVADRAGGLLADGEMTLVLLATLVRRRPTLLTDLLDAPAEVKRWVFEKLGVHEGVHEFCPGWCPCEIDLGLDEDEAGEELAWAA